MEVQTTTKKAVDRTTYMREYKKKKYAENPDLIKGKNKSYYYKYKCGLTAEDMEKYDTLLPYVAKIKMAVDEFKEKDIEKSVAYLEEILGLLKQQKEVVV